jgi:hypothetical protein
MLTNSENNDRPREETTSESNSGRNGDHPQGNRAETIADSNMGTNCECKHGDV